MSKKLEWLECIRGGAILLVVLGHLTLIGGQGAYSDVIYTFHMPLFFALSGFLYGYHELRCFQSPGKFLRKKLIALGIPYLIFSVFYIFFDLALQKFVQTNTVITLKDAVALLWNPVAHYWFLWVLLLYFAVVACCGNTNRKLQILTLVGFAVTLLENTLMQGMRSAYHHGLAYFFYFAAAGLIGTAFAEKGIKEIAPSIATGALLLVSGTAFVLLIWQNETLENTAIRATLLRILGIVAFSTGVIFVSGVPLFKKTLMKIGRDSWYIYLLHSYFLCAARLGLKHVFPLGCPVAEIVVGMAFSVIGCMVVGWISRQNRWLDGMFYPRHLHPNKKIVGKRR